MPRQQSSLSPSLFGKEVEEEREWKMMDSNKEVNKEGRREVSANSGTVAGIVRTSFYFCSCLRAVQIEAQRITTTPFGVVVSRDDQLTTEFI